MDGTQLATLEVKNRLHINYYLEPNSVSEGVIQREVRCENRTWHVVITIYISCSYFMFGFIESFSLTGLFREIYIVICEMLTSKATLSEIQSKQIAKTGLKHWNQSAISRNQKLKMAWNIKECLEKHTHTLYINISHKKERCTATYRNPKHSLSADIRLSPYNILYVCTQGWSACWCVYVWTEGCVCFGILETNASPSFIRIPVPPCCRACLVIGNGISCLVLRALSRYQMNMCQTITFTRTML